MSNENQSPLIKFYSGNSDYPYNINNILYNWSTDKLERTHDYIQWIFPTVTRSSCNPNAPILTKEDCIELKSKYSDKVTYTVMTFVNFIILAKPFENKDDHNHNYLRLSRLFEFLLLYGSPKYAEGLKNHIIETYYVPVKTIEIWDKIFKTVKPL